ncbi:MAG: hypothetical protein R2911_01930 [Caldilineaceae bacterium]
MLRLENVFAGYGSIAALRGISLEVAQGELVALIGVNGWQKHDFGHHCGYLAPHFRQHSV